MTASLTAPMPVRWPVLRSCFRANASRPFITSWPVWNISRYVRASPSPRSTAFGRWTVLAEDSRARVAAGAATANPAAAKKHRRVNDRFPGVAIGSSFLRLRLGAVEPLSLAFGHHVPTASTVPEGQRRKLARGAHDL